MVESSDWKASNANSRINRTAISSTTYLTTLGLVVTLNCMKLWPWKRTIALLLVAIATRESSKADFDDFEKSVRPLLVAHCYECHSGSEAKGGLLLDTRDGVLKGGESGAAIVAGNPERSLMVQATRYTNPDLQMPPKGRLTAVEVNALEKTKALCKRPHTMIRQSLAANERIRLPKPTSICDGLLSYRSRFPNTCEAPSNYEINLCTTCPLTSVRRMSRPPNRKVDRL